jgi:hypothetical protein
MATNPDRGWTGTGAGWMVRVLALLIWSGQTQAQNPAVPQNQLDEMKASVVSVFSVWLKGRFSAAELKGLQPDELQLESHYCSCYDEPTPHYPYPLVVLRTPRGDLVTRPDSHEGAVSFAPLAVRHGDRYCEVESEQVCFGTFPEPCDFTDFRFGPNLRPFFPTCKSQDLGSSAPFEADSYR